MKVYLDLMQDILDNGVDHADRTGTGRRSVFGRMVRFNLKDGLPLVTTRNIYTKALIHELLWFIAGNTNADDLSKNGVKIWDKWKVRQEDIDDYFELYKYQVDDQDAFKEYLDKETLGNIGRMYGHVWRYTVLTNNQVLDNNKPLAKDIIEKITNYYNENNISESGKTLEEFLKESNNKIVDQLNNLIIGLKENPWSSRHIISAWDPTVIPHDGISPQMNVLLGKGALAPCHVLQQYIVYPGDTPDSKPKLSLMMTQRSLDLPVGGPYNIAQYSILLSMIAQVVDMEPHEFIWSIGDAHIYLDQIELAKEQVKLEPQPLPKLVLNKEITEIYDFKFEDIQIVDYNPLEKINYPVSV